MINYQEMGFGIGYARRSWGEEIALYRMFTSLAVAMIWK